MGTWLKCIRDTLCEVSWRKLFVVCGIAEFEQDLRNKGHGDIECVTLESREGPVRCLYKYKRAPENTGRCRGSEIVDETPAAFASYLLEQLTRLKYSMLGSQNFE